VLSVGDLHASNSGTWRDVKGESIWGINDFYEAVHLPITKDLIMLAASVELIEKTETAHPAGRGEAMLDSYRGFLEKGRKALVILGDMGE
jgi:uncharacterized protein (DUF2252 family)